MTAAPCQRIVQAVRDRIQESAQQRRRSLEAIRSDRPLDAEPSEARKVARIQRVTGLKPSDAERLATYRCRPENLGLTGERRLGAERIQGLTTDFVGVAFLDLARTAANAIGRVAFRDHQPQGTGFLISPNLFLTNNHVIDSVDAARQFVIEFNYQLGIDGRPTEITRYECAPATFFITNDENDLDFTVIALGRKLDGPGSLRDFGFCRLNNSPDRHALGEFVNIVQHPAGDYKQVVLRENRLVWRSDRVLHYIADTEPGSSGSPVFNDQWEPIALHHWGEPFRDVNDADGRPLNREVNEGIRISAIYTILRGATGLTAAQSNLLKEAVPDAGEGIPVVPEHFVPAPGERPPVNIVPVRIAADGKVTWTLPLEITIGIGGLPAPPPPAAKPAAAARAPERVKIDADYSNRKGYQSDFLPGFDVDLPELPAGQAAPSLIGDRNSHVLDYEHFSVVMNGDRRMAFVTAVNINGKKTVRITRDTGLPAEEEEAAGDWFGESLSAEAAEAAEATEKWTVDPRLDARFQCDQPLYDDQRPRRLFDRGHLVRREDPNWGSDDDAIRANADTFHFTNCTPQASTFNQQARFWQGIENYVLRNARSEKRKVSVFTGPVFRDDDPEYRDIRVPRQFWKIVVRVEDDELLATALLADQSDMIRRMPESAGRIVEDERRAGEAFADLGNVEQYQTTVANIERLTGLDFGDLRDHDTNPEGPEAVRPSRVRSFEDISLYRTQAAAARTPR